MQFLYRCYDARGRLLYVGISFSALTRMQKHRYESRWFRRVSRIEVEHIPDRASAREAERKAIHTEFPFFNRTHRRYTMRRAIEKQEIRLSWERHDQRELARKAAMVDQKNKLARDRAAKFKEEMYSPESQAVVASKVKNALPILEGVES
jgi:hypothetical protein